jgi:hypothetical protein
MLRDSAMFSVVAAEWPAVNSALRTRLTSLSTVERDQDDGQPRRDNLAT